MALSVVRTGNVALDRFLDEVRRKIDTLESTTKTITIRGGSGGSTAFTATETAYIEKLAREITNSRLAQELRNPIDVARVQSELGRLRTELFARIQQAGAEFSAGVDYASIQEAKDRIAGDIASVQATVDAIAQEVLDRNAAILVETNARVADVNQETADRTAAIAVAAATAHDELTVQATMLSNAIFAESNTRTQEIAANAESIIRTALAAESIYDDAQTTIATAKSDLTATFEYGLSAEATARQLLAAQVNANTAAVFSEQTARATADSAMAEDITVLFAETGTNTALITSETTARTTADSALGTRIDALIVSTDASDAAIVATQTANATAAAATAASLTTLTTRVGAAETAILDEATARSDGDTAEATSRNALATQLRGSHTGSDLSALTSGLLYQERTARSTAVDGLAQQITLLSAGAGEQFDWAQIFYFDASIEGWTGTGTPTATGGWLRPADSSTPAVTSPGSLGVNGSQYTQVRLRIRKTGSPVWVGSLTWSGGSTTFAVPTFDANGIGLVTINTGWTGTINQLTVELSADQTATDYYEMDWFAIGRPSPGASSAQLYAEQLARTNADSALTTDILTLSSKVDTGDAISIAAINTEATTRATKDTAQAGQVETMVASLGANIAAITTEATTRTTKDDATATTLQTLSVSMGDSVAGIKTEATARTTADTATAGQVNTLSAGVGQVQAGIIDEQAIRVTETTALAQTQSVLAASIGASQAGLATQSKVSADAESALAQGQLALYSSVGEARAGLTVEQITRTNQDSALSQQIVAMAATMGDNTAALKVEQSTRATQDTAQASQITTLGAVTGDAVAGLKSEQSTRAAADTAVSSQITVLTAATGDLAASVTIASNAVADLTTAQAETSTSLLATTRQLDISDEELAEAALRNALSVDKSKTYLLGTVALAESKMTTYVDEGLLAEATNRTALAAVVDGVSSGLTVEQTARATQDAALASQVTTLSASIGDNASSIKTEQTVRANETMAVASQVETVYAAVGGNVASILTTQQASATADNALAALTTTLAASVGDATSAIVSEQSARATKDSAQASQINGLDVALGNSFASIITEQVARITSDSSTAQQIFALLAQTATAMAAILEEKNVRTTEDSAIAGSVTTQIASLGTEVASVEVTANAAVSKADGALAHYGVKLNAAGHAAGFGLSAYADPTGTLTSDFIVQANKFAVVPTYTYIQEGTPSSPTSGQTWYKVSTKASKRYNGSTWLTFTPPVPFSIDTASGKVVMQSDVAIGGDLIVNGTITNNGLAGGITSGKIASVDAATITVGQLTASQIDSRGLSIKDALGNVILAAGTALDYTNVGGTKPPSDADKTSANTAAGIAGQGAFATLGQIQYSNVSTYIANAAITMAQIDKLSVDSSKVFNSGITVFSGATAKTAILANNYESAALDGTAARVGVLGHVVSHATNGTYGPLVGTAGIVNDVRAAVPTAGVYGQTSGGLANNTAGVYGDCGVSVPGAAVWAVNRSTSGYAMRIEGSTAGNARIIWNGQAIAAPVSGGTGFLKQDGSWATPATGSVAWADVTGKPTTFTPEAHNQDWTTITGKPTTFAPETHTHTNKVTYAGYLESQAGQSASPNGHKVYLHWTGAALQVWVNDTRVL